MRSLPPDHGFRALLLLALTACASKSPASPPDAPEPPMPEPTPSQAASTDDDAPPVAPGEAGPPEELAGSVRPGWTKYTGCADWKPGAGATPAESVDGLALRVHNAMTPAPQPTEGNPAIKPTCTAATDPAACATALGALPMGGIRSQMTQMGEFRYDLVFTRGDKVGSIPDRAALVAWLGPVDSAGDAQLLAWADGYTPACDEGPHEGDAGWFVQAIKQVNDCPVTTHSYDLRVAPDGAVTVLAEHQGTPSQVCIGRLPPGLIALPEGPGLAAWLTRVAHLEAAAVHAFDQLIRELEHHRAPARLIEAARGARLDEVRHAQIFTELAAALGAEVPAADWTAVEVRSLPEIAADNAREGLVRERYGAAVGLWQARHATEPGLRAAFREVALDEVRHAELSIALDRWLRTQLSPAECRALDRATQRAIAESTPTDPVDVQLAARLGLPDGATARALFALVTDPDSVPAAPPEGQRATG